MLVHWLVDETGTVQDNWIEWFVERTAALNRVLYIGCDRRWPGANMDAPRVQRLLPLICSINPMGTPCCRLRLPTPSNPAVTTEVATDLRRLLNRSRRPRPFFVVLFGLPAPESPTTVVAGALERGGSDGLPVDERGRLGIAGVVTVGGTTGDRTDAGGGRGTFANNVPR